MNQIELKNKIQQLITQRESRLSNILNLCYQWNEEVGTLKRLRDFEGEQLLMCLGWLSIKHNRHQLTSVIKENLLETLEKEVSLIENNNFLAQQLTNEELLQELSTRIEKREIKIDWQEMGEDYLEQSVVFGLYTNHYHLEIYESRENFPSRAERKIKETS